jgi:hypothetical protein
VRPRSWVERRGLSAIGQKRKSCTPKPCPADRTFERAYSQAARTDVRYGSKSDFLPELERPFDRLQ